MSTSIKGTDIYIFHEDPSHGWLEVPKAVLSELGIEDQISRYSYMRGNMAYLEEDCDLSLFASHWQRYTGTTFTFANCESRHTNGVSFVRGFYEYKVERKRE